MSTKKDDGKVNIHGKEYLTVAYRINKFREDHKSHCITTDIYSSGDKLVVVKATIIDHGDRVVATGFAEEDRTKGTINKTSALENCETSAVGRALAFFGYAGTEIASADEVANANAIAQQNQTSSKQAPKSDLHPMHNWSVDFTEKLKNCNGPDDLVLLITTEEDGIGDCTPQMVNEFKKLIHTKSNGSFAWPQHLKGK